MNFNLFRLISDSYSDALLHVFLLLSYNYILFCFIIGFYFYIRRKRDSDRSNSLYGYHDFTLTVNLPST